MAQLTGVIQSITPGEIKVLVSDASEEACGACALYDTCMSSNRVEGAEAGKKDLSARVISVFDFPVGLSVGDNVTLEEAPGLQLKGAFYAFILPLIVLVLAAVWLSRAGASESAIVGALLGLLILYGLAMWMMREQFKRMLFYKISSVAEAADRIC